VTQPAARVDDRLQLPDLSRRARTRKLVLLAVVLAAGAGAYAYQTRPRPQSERYRTEGVTRRTIIQLVEATGTLDVRSRVEVPAPLAGRITSIAVEPRDRVTKGQLLGTLDERAAELALRSAKTTVEAASGRVAQAQVAVAGLQQKLANAKRLRDKGLASEQSLVELQAELDQARAMVDAARAERKLASETVASAELGRSLSAIVAPVAGVILQAPERMGAAVSPERGPLFVLGESLEVMRIDALVAETEIARIEPGKYADVLVQALPGKTFSASVQRIGIEPKRDAGVVNYPVTLLVENAGGALLPGMSARVRMEVARVENALAVHDAALRFTPEDAEPADARSRVFRRTGPSELEAVKVRAGISDGVYTAVEAIDGATLSENDELAVGLGQSDARAGKPSLSLGGKN
jgi:HlyD family secretion protein